MSWQGKSVMIVDDSNVIQMSLIETFEKLGMRVAGVCGDGLAALDLYSQHKPDLVCLDIIMPKMHGIECLRALLKINPELKVILSSCLSSNAKVPLAFEQEIAAGLFLPKPLTEEALVPCLTKLFA